jgi:hypothetical protein
MTTRLERAFAARADRLAPAVRAILTVAAVDELLSPQQANRRPGGAGPVRP